jgi:hypothetical protein
MCALNVPMMKQCKRATATMQAELARLQSPLEKARRVATYARIIAAGRAAVLPLLSSL